MKTYTVYARRLPTDDGWSWNIPELNIESETKRLLEIEDDARSIIAMRGDVSGEWTTEMYMRYDAKAAEEKHGGVISMCHLVG